MKKALPKRAHVTLLHLYKVLEQAKLIYGIKKSEKCLTQGIEMKINWKETWQAILIF